MLPARGPGMVLGCRWDLGWGWGAGTPVRGWELSLVMTNPPVGSFQDEPKPPQVFIWPLLRRAEGGSHPKTGTLGWLGAVPCPAILALLLG